MKIEASVKCDQQSDFTLEYEQKTKLENCGKDQEIVCGYKQ